MSGEINIPALPGHNPFQEQIRQADEEERLKYEQECMDVLRTFSTPHGRRTLALMKRAADQMPGYEPGFGIINGIAYGFARDGQKTLIRTLETIMQHAVDFKKAEKHADD